MPVDAESNAPPPSGRSGGRKVEDLPLEEMAGDAAVPRSNGELVFDAPWHARAFGLAVALAREGRFDWPDFQRALTEEVRRRGQCGVDAYYRCWLEALRTVLSGILDADAIQLREGEFRSHLRDEVF